MKIPEKLKETGKSLQFRETQRLCVAYKLINLVSLRETNAPNVRDLHESVVVDVRVFWPNNSQTCRAAIWIYDRNGNRYGRGVGITSGGGYHHESAAIQDAFADMGILFEGAEAFDGMGTRAQETAICKVGEALGYANTLLVDVTP